MKINVFVIIVISILIGVVLGFGINKWLCTTCDSQLSDTLLIANPIEKIEKAENQEATKIEDEHTYFWSYKDIEDYAEVLSTSVYDEIEDRYRIISKSNVEQNALASLIKMHGEEKGYREFESFFGGILGDSTTWIRDEVNFEEDRPIFLKKDFTELDFKYVQVHENVINDVWDFAINGKDANYLKYEKQYLEEAKASNDEDAIRVNEETIKEAEETIDKMEKDPVVIGMRKHCKEPEDMTMEEIAHIGATYTTGYWKRPEDSHYSVHRVFIMNGNNISEDNYYREGRAKKLKITIKETEYTLELVDTPECQICNIDFETDDIYNPLEIKVELLEAYPLEGRDAVAKKDTAYISSIKFDVDATVFAGGR